MNSAQRALIIVLLVVVAAVMAFVFLEWGEGAFSNMAGNRIAIFVWEKGDPNSMFGSGYGLFTTFGIPGVLLGLVAPIVLLAAAGFVALGASWRRL